MSSTGLLVLAMIVLSPPGVVETASASDECPPASSMQEGCLLSCLGVLRPIVIGYRVEVTGAGYSGFAANTDKGDYGFFLYYSHDTSGQEEEWFYYMTGHSINARCLGGPADVVCGFASESRPTDDQFPVVPAQLAANQTAKQTMADCAVALGNPSLES